MKSIRFAILLASVALISSGSSITSAKAQEADTSSNTSAADQAESVEQSSQQATQDVTEEDAHADAGSGFDGNAPSPEAQH